MGARIGQAQVVVQKQSFTTTPKGKELPRTSSPKNTAFPASPDLDVEVVVGRRENDFPLELKSR